MFILILLDQFDRGRQGVPLQFAPAVEDSTGDYMSHDNLVNLHR